MKDLCLICNNDQKDLCLICNINKAIDVERVVVRDESEVKKSGARASKNKCH